MPKFTKEELKNLIDARIRSVAASYLGDIEFVGFEAEDEQLKSFYQKIFDNIISVAGYDENVLEAIRAVRFNISYIRRVVKRGIKDNFFRMESLKKQKNIVVEVVKEHFEGQKKSD